MMTRQGFCACCRVTGTRHFRERRRPACSLWRPAEDIIRSPASCETGTPLCQVTSNLGIVFRRAAGNCRRAACAPQSFRSAWSRFASAILRERLRLAGTFRRPAGKRSVKKIGIILLGCLMPRLPLLTKSDRAGRPLEHPRRVRSRNFCSTSIRCFGASSRRKVV
jgi:hypothetical protein